MPDVCSIAPADVDRWIVFDVHKNSLVASVLPATGGSPEVSRVENTERAVRRYLDRLGGPDGLAVAYEAGPCGYDLFRLLSRMGVACDVIAPSLVPVRAGDRVKTDRRDAKKLRSLTTSSRRRSIANGRSNPLVEAFRIGKNPGTCESGKSRIQTVRAETSHGCRVRPSFWYASFARPTQRFVTIPTGASLCCTADS